MYIFGEMREKFILNKTLHFCLNDSYSLFNQIILHVKNINKNLLSIDDQVEK
jgi:hypothetical protein